MLNQPNVHASSFQQIGHLYVQGNSSAHLDFWEAAFWADIAFDRYKNTQKGGWV